MNAGKVYADLKASECKELQIHSPAKVMVTLNFRVFFQSSAGIFNFIKML